MIHDTACCYFFARASSDSSARYMPTWFDENVCAKPYIAYGNNVIPVYLYIYSGRF